MQEGDPAESKSAARQYFSQSPVFAPTPVGCGELAGLEPSSGTTLGAVSLGRKPGRLNDSEITVYKAMGIAPDTNYVNEGRPVYVTNNGKGVPVDAMFT